MELVQLDFRNVDLKLAHEKLGETVQAQVYKILNEKINTEAYEEFIGDVRKARLIAATLPVSITLSKA